MNDAQNEQKDVPVERKAYPTDVSDEEWAFVEPYLVLINPEAPQRQHPLREVFNALRYVAHARQGSYEPEPPGDS